MKRSLQSSVILYACALLAALFLIVLSSGNVTAECGGQKGIKFGISPTNLDIQRGQTLFFNWTVTACTIPDYVNFTIAAPDGSIIVDPNYLGSSGMLVNYTWVVPLDAALGTYWAGVDYYPDYYPYSYYEQKESSARIAFLVVPTPKLTLIKTVTNDNGGIKEVLDFPLFIDGTPATSGEAYEVAAYIEHIVSETLDPAYSSTISGDCAADGTITIQPGDDKTCTITNDDIPGTIMIVKNTLGGDDSFDFTVAGPSQATPTVTTTGGTGNTGFITSDAGSYSISETDIPEGWDLTGSSCTSGSPDDFTLPLDGSITCTFENTKRGHLIVHKVTDPPSDATTLFSITASGTGTIIGPATATITGGSSHDYEVTPGTYSVSEDAVPAGWDKTGDTCQGVDVVAGETEQCTITNTKLGKIIIEKQTLPDDDTEFSFAGDVSGSLSDGQTAFTDGLLPNAYTSTETVPIGWELNSITCNDADSTGNVGTAMATFNLQAGEIITCVFENEKAGKIVVVKNTLGGDGSFDFDATGTGLPADIYLTTLSGTASQTFDDLDVDNTYTVAENVPVGWELNSATCDNGETIDSINLDPGQTVTCIFENEKLGTIVVIKNAAGGDEIFDYTTTGGDNLPSVFTIATFGGTDTETFPNIDVDNTYAITESAEVGWDFIGAFCDNGETIDSIDLLLGETVTCTFENEKHGHITIVKQTDPDGASGSFDFTGDVGGTLLDGGSATEEVSPGTYTSTESDPTPAFDLTDISCDDDDSTGNEGTRTATFEVQPGEDVTCTFTNTQKGKILVDKVTDPSQDPQEFTFTPDYTSQFVLTDIDTLKDSGWLAPGTYSVSETVPSGWDQTDATCSDGSPVSTISLQAGEVVTCTFENTKRGHLIVQKTTDPTADPTVFTISASGSGTITGGGAETVTDASDKDYEVTLGTYSVAETVPAGWDKTGDTCQNIAVAAGETKTCLLTNVKRGHIIIDKTTIPSGDSKSFSFTPSYGSQFSLTDAATPDNQELVPGTYSVAETVPSDWDLTDTTCVSSVQDTETADNLELDAGETITCTFKNTKHSKIIIEKQTLPNGDTTEFSFAGNVGGSLTDGEITEQEVSPGAYSSIETVPVGWELNSITCNDGESEVSSSGDVGTATANFNVESGEVVTCTFENEKFGKITIVKNTLGDDGTFDFTSTTLPDTTFSITTSGNTGSQEFDNLDVDSNYDVDETVPEGWELNSASCSDGSPIDNIDLSPGEEVVCTFENEQEGTLIIIKNTLGGDGIFDFDTTGGSTVPAEFSLTTVSNTDSEIFNNVDIDNTYTVVETVPTGWELNSATCDNGETVDSLDVDAGETVTCTFTNTKRGEIHGTKFNDINGNGVWDDDEPGLSGWEIKLDGDAQTTTTDTNGYYAFLNLVPDDYTITETLQAGWMQTLGASNPVSVAPGQIVNDVNFGNFQLGKISGMKFNDSNGNGVKDPGELGLSGWTINLAGPDASSSSTTTDDNGNYQFTGLHAGTYTLTETVQDGWIKTTTNPAPVLVQSGTNSQGNDFGNFKLAKIIIHKNVLDPDGGEVTDAHLFTVKLDDANQQLIAEGTDATYDGLGSGIYSITEAADADYDFDSISQSQVTTTSGSITDVFVVNKQKQATIIVVKDVLAPDGVTDVTDDHQFSVTLNGETKPFKESLSASFIVNPGTYDAVEGADNDYELVTNDGPAIVGSNGEATITIRNKQKPAEIRGVKFNDFNANGLKDGGDTGLPGWIIYLDANDNGLFDSEEIFTITDENGEYSFTNLVQGTYHVREVLKDVWMQTAPSSGKYDVTLAIGQVANGNDFGNFALATIVVHKNVLAPDGETDITDPHVFIVRLNGASPQPFVEGADTIYGGLAPGTYTVSEDNDADYNLISITPPSSVTPESGSTTHVYVVNKQKNLASITTSASSSTVILGDSVYDTATILGVPGIQITGTVSFYVCNTPTCLSGGTLLGTVIVGENDGTSVTVVGPTFTPITAGSYSFRAEYSGDENYAPSIDNGTNEAFSVEQTATRTVYFWETHTDFTSSIFGSEFGTMTIGDITHSKTIDGTPPSSALNKLFGAYYSDVSKKTNDEWRNSADYARMMLLQQLVTAKLNCAAFGCSGPINALIAAADTAYAGDDADLMLLLGAQLEAFNNSGEAQAIPPELGPVGSETPETSESIADKVFWNTP